MKSSWLLQLSCNKRRVAPIAALLSAVLHPAVFSDLNMHETDGKEKGPLKWVSLLVINLSCVDPRISSQLPLAVIYKPLFSVVC